MPIRQLVCIPSPRAGRVPAKLRYVAVAVLRRSSHAVSTTAWIEDSQKVAYLGTHHVLPADLLVEHRFLKHECGGYARRKNGFVVTALPSKRIGTNGLPVPVDLQEPRYQSRGVDLDVPCPMPRHSPSGWQAQG